MKKLVASKIESGFMNLIENQSELKSSNLTESNQR